MPILSSSAGRPVRTVLVALRTLAPLAVLAAPLAVAYVVIAAPGARAVCVEPAVVPSDVLFYTHVRYGGDDAYLVDGKWYRPGAAGWVVFTREPIELELVRRSSQSPQPSFLSWFAFTSGSALGSR